MARFFFHVIDGTFLPDTVGDVFPDVAAAQVGALARAASLIGSRELSFWRDGMIQVVIADEAGDSKLELTISARGFPASQKPST